MTYDVVIIGAGPAGLTAGIYAGRAGVSTLIIEKLFAGGQASQTYEIENYPGYVKVGGFELTAEMEKQAIASGAEIIYEEIESVDLEARVITLSGQKKIEARSIIIASGATHSHLGAQGEEELIGSGVSYCATCDGAFFKDKTVAVVGGGNTAVGDVLYLMRFAKEVYIIHRRNEFRASPLLVERLKESGAKIKTPYTVKSIHKGEKGKLSGVTLINVDTKEEESLALDGLFVAVGQTPDTALFDLKKDERGYIIAGEDTLTSKEGVFAAGDCRVKPLRQIVTAASDGAIAAEQAVQYITLKK